ncbi:MAG: hypothetical protein EXR69_00350 [Myxococcales bacterium]|nr:hypothetical protein [Myxococcales bacterium]
MLTRPMRPSSVSLQLTLWGALLTGCSNARTIGPWDLVPTGTGFDISRSDGSEFVGSLTIEIGIGEANVEFQAGAYRFGGESTEWKALIPSGGPSGRDPAVTWKLEDEHGDDYGLVSAAELRDGILAVAVVANDPEVNRTRFSVPCTGNDHFAGFGQHAQDVDHVGEAFPLWVSEPGIGKTGDETQGDDWFLTGTKHASSYPDPFFIKPDPLGVEIVTESRVEVDLCTGDDWSVAAWSGATEILFYDVTTPMEAVQKHALRSGSPVLPPAWAFAPWNDAVGGEDRVKHVASVLREAGATAGVIWTEDWKGGEDSVYGYHLIPSWDVDETLYPDAAGLASELRANGFGWFAYFQPFLVEGTDAWEEAGEFAIRREDGSTYTFVGMTFETTTVLDLTREDARDWARGKMQAALDLGFTGWMADFAEWLPTDAVLAGADALAAHNAYPLWWQETNAAVLSGPAESSGGESSGGETTGVQFTRSGWTGSPTLSPIGWAGDQRTSFDADDGFPTVIPMGIGAGISGLPLYTHDIGGYQSIGNEPSTKELWWRWCTLGAMSPIMRTHHGAFMAENWQFDSDAETLALYVTWSRVHGRMAPYRRGLAVEAQRQGTPLVRAPFLTWPDEDWARTDAWLLGDLLVAPVMEEGAVSRRVDLPAAVGWFDFWTGEAAQTGTFDVPLDSIAVFAPVGAIVPMYTDIADTLFDGPLSGLVTADEVDTGRTVHVFASGGASVSGRFEEADGTTYTVTGTATGPAEATVRTASGDVVVAGLTVQIRGPVERTYAVVVR